MAKRRNKKQIELGGRGIPDTSWSQEFAQTSELKLVVDFSGTGEVNEGHWITSFFRTQEQLKALAKTFDEENGTAFLSSLAFLPPPTDRQSIKGKEEPAGGKLIITGKENIKIFKALVKTEWPSTKFTIHREATEGETKTIHDASAEAPQEPTALNLYDADEMGAMQHANKFKRSALQEAFARKIRGAALSKKSRNR